MNLANWPSGPKLTRLERRHPTTERLMKDGSPGYGQSGLPASNERDRSYMQTSWYPNSVGLTVTAR
jgi:hypothetical protein